MFDEARNISETTQSRGLMRNPAIKPNFLFHFFKREITVDEPEPTQNWSYFLCSWN